MNTITSIQHAKVAGEQRGRQDAWNVEVDDDLAREIVDAYESGEWPESLEYAPLSGEWAGESIPEIFGTSEVDEFLLEAYEWAATDTFIATLTAIAFGEG